jgi:hypothetical protein
VSLSVASGWWTSCAHELNDSTGCTLSGRRQAIVDGTSSGTGVAGALYLHIYSDRVGATAIGSLSIRIGLPVVQREPPSLRATVRQPACLRHSEDLVRIPEILAASLVGRAETATCV